MKALITSAKIESKVHIIRNQSVMLDSDLAELYGVKTKVLVQAVKRNMKRFPADFMFQLNQSEHQFLRSQIVTLETGRGKYSKYLSYVFTEQGVAMLSSVLNSPNAVQVNIQIMRAFIHLRGFQFSYANLRREVQAMRKKYDAKFASVFKSIEALMDGPKRPINVKGFGK